MRANFRKLMRFMPFMVPPAGGVVNAEPGLSPPCRSRPAQPEWAKPFAALGASHERRYALDRPADRRATSPSGAALPGNRPGAGGPTRPARPPADLSADGGPRPAGRGARPG